MEPTLGFRFVMRDGKRILQQRWVMNLADGARFDWIDIPLVEETADPNIPRVSTR